jgi:hypothetical protein
MCSTSKVIRFEVQQMLAGIYSSLKFQFILADSKLVFDVNSSENHHHLFSTFIQLRTDFQLMELFELKLAFPAVINLFEQKNSIKKRSSSEIIELLDLSKSMEEKLFQVIEKLKIQLIAIDFEIGKSEIEELINIFETDFFQQKSNWKKLIQQKIDGCKCLHTINLTVQ